MPTISILRNTTLVMAGACLVIAYLWAGHWLIAPALGALVVSWFVLRRSSPLWRSSFLFVSYVGLAIAAVVLRMPFVPLALGSASALAAWDLFNFENMLGIAASPEHARRILSAHLLALGTALGLGILLESLSMLIEIDLPFALNAAIALVLVACLVAAIQRLRASPS